jgi:hypothetical protein
MSVEEVQEPKMELVLIFDHVEGQKQQLFVLGVEHVPTNNNCKWSEQFVNLL